MLRSQRKTHTPAASEEGYTISAEYYHGDKHQHTNELRDSVILFSTYSSRRHDGQTFYFPENTKKTM